MRISVADARDQLDDLVRRAEAGDEIVLTRESGRDVRLVPEPEPRSRLTKEARLKLIREIQESAAKNMIPGPDAARSQDFLYDEFGLPK